MNISFISTRKFTGFGMDFREKSPTMFIMKVELLQKVYITHVSNLNMYSALSMLINILDIYLL